MNDPRPGFAQSSGGQIGQGMPQPMRANPAMPGQPPPLRPNPNQPMQTPVPLHPSTGLPAPNRPPVAEEPISLVDEAPAPTPGPATAGAPPAAPAPSKIQAFGVRALSHVNESFKRAPNLNKTGAVRVRSFHGRLSEQGLEFMDHLINEWLDNHADVEIKFVTSTTGIFDGKMKEPAVILNVWY
jgi:hypothetical protein